MSSRNSILNWSCLELKIAIGKGALKEVEEPLARLMGRGV